MQVSLNQNIIRVFIFIFLILLISIFLYPVLQVAFVSNIYINSIIILALFFGLIFCIYNLLLLKNNYEVLASFNIHKSPKILSQNNNFLKNLVLELYKNEDQYKFKSSRIEKIVESLDMSLTSVRDTSKYLVGLLVFLGLLGTFWGLLKTIGSVGNVIGGLGIDDTNVAGFFNSLKSGLTAPLDGMSIAFSSSLLGLAGSLILGFVDLQLGQAQLKFSQFAEKVILNNSAPDFIQGSTEIDNSTLSSIQKIYDNLSSLLFVIKENSKNQNQIFSFMKDLANQISNLNSLSIEQEKKLSNFLSTQINTQSNTLKLISEISKKKTIDSELKKTLKNIEKGLSNLKNISKEK